MNKQRIGFISGGVMGAPMAGHLAGQAALAIHDIDRVERILQPERTYCGCRHKAIGEMSMS
jgi:3-hydroxyisobutyrate dehydrogenase-like beta-hydroxyacid dehydrogenase